MMTSDWAPANGARAVEAELVEVATVLVSPRAMTSPMSSPTKLPFAMFES